MTNRNTGTWFRGKSLKVSIDLDCLIPKKNWVAFTNPLCIHLKLLHVLSPPRKKKKSWETWAMNLWLSIECWNLPLIFLFQITKGLLLQSTGTVSFKKTPTISHLWDVQTFRSSSSLAFLLGALAVSKIDQKLKRWFLFSFFRLAPHARIFRKIKTKNAKKRSRQPKNPKDPSYVLRKIPLKSWGWEHLSPTLKGGVWILRVKIGFWNHETIPDAFFLCKIDPPWVKKEGPTPLLKGIQLI